MSQLKVGDKVRVIREAGHSFKLGDIVRCADIKDLPSGASGLHRFVDDTGFYQCMAPSNYEVITEEDNVNHPTHYTSHPSGIECIDVTRHMSFNVGNAVKYLWRADLKDNPSRGSREG